MHPNNQPAFPVCDAARIHNLEGISIRDYFAAKAMQGICNGRSHSDLKGHAVASAKVAYEVADAMLKAREA
jgi:hypothetical protein